MSSRGTRGCDVRDVAPEVAHTHTHRAQSSSLPRTCQPGWGAQRSLWPETSLFIVPAQAETISLLYRTLPRSFKTSCLSAFSFPGFSSRFEGKTETLKTVMASLSAQGGLCFALRLLTLLWGKTTHREVSVTFHSMFYHSVFRSQQKWFKYPYCT